MTIHEDFPDLAGSCGAAFLLDTPAKTSLTVLTPDGLVALRKDAPYATVALTTAKPQQDAKDEAWRVLQEALDVLAASRRATLQTAEGDCTYLLWVPDGSAGYELVFVDTADGSWSVSGSISVEGATPAAPPASPPPLPRHPALRFYRLARASPDLFDAFRNAYLALECLASESTSKGPSEGEPAWLKRALAGPLSTGIPAGVIGPSTIDDIYRDGRLPTFHAKTGSSFYAPHGPERAAMQERLETLLLLVNCLLQDRFGHQFVSRDASMSQDMYDSMAAASFTFNEISFSDGQAEAAVAAVAQTISSPRRFNQLWGRTTVTRPATLDWVSVYETRKDGGAWTTAVLEERVPLRGVSKISIEINLLQYASGSKRPAHRR